MTKQLTGWKCLDDRSLTADMLRNNPEIAKEFVDSLTEQELDALQHSWAFWARDEQLPPLEWIGGDCYIWGLRCGRGWGKTRTAAQIVIEAVKAGYRHLSLCGATAEEVRDIMINGKSGIKSICPPWLGLDYKPSIKKVLFSNGAVISIFYGTEPERARGPESDFIWMDEIDKWDYPQETFDNLLLGLRLGKKPLCIVTSTPKPAGVMKQLETLKAKNGKQVAIVTIGSTYENKQNLSQTFIDTIITKYEGTRLGLQELHAQILDDNPNALFKREWIENNRVDELPSGRGRLRTVVGVDPAITDNQNTSNETGIITILEGIAPERLLRGGEVQFKNEKHYYVLFDNSLIASPNRWAQQVKKAIYESEADVVVVEDNQGGDMVESNLVNNGVNKHMIHRVHSVSSKVARALNASTLCEQGRVHFLRRSNVYNTQHGYDELDVLENQLCNWQPGDKSPDRMDALVHAINYCEPDLQDPVKEDIAKTAAVRIFGRY